MDTIGSRIKALRLKNNKTLKEVSKAVDISVSFLSDIENNRSNPSLERLRDIANYFGVSISYLMGEDYSQSSVEQVMSFNKAKFAKLLKKAKGDRSINQYAKECGVSSAYISRLLREMVNTSPSPEIIEKLSSCAHNHVSYIDLMKAAGYISDENRRTEHIPVLKSRINQLRLSKNLTEQELAKELGTSEQEVISWENGSSAPAYDMLVKIADYFGVSTDYLLGRTDFPDSKVHEEVIEGRKVRIDYDMNEYPDGLTHERVIAILKHLKAAGFSFSPGPDNGEEK